VIHERESVALQRWLEDAVSPVSSALLRAELVRAVHQHGSPAVMRARTLLAQVDLIAVDDAILDLASKLPPTRLRTLDAIHLATAISLGDELSSLATYDVRMMEAAELAGLSIASPA